jgi:hypothetical protein
LAMSYVGMKVMCTENFYLWGKNAFQKMRGERGQRRGASPDQAGMASLPFS